MSIGLATKGMLSDGIGDGISERIYILELGVDVMLDDPEILVEADDILMAAEFNDLTVAIEIPDEETREVLESTVEVDV